MSVRHTLVRLKGEYVRTDPKTSDSKRRIVLPVYILDLHVHSLRHTHASLLINGNFTAKVVANRLGHVNTRTTLEVYSHVFAETEEKAMQTIDMSLFRKAE